MLSELQKRMEVSVLLLKSILKPGMRGVFYGRHSTDRQTMDAQRNIALDFIRKYDCIYVREYLDPAVSARIKSLSERKGISELLSDSYKNIYDFIVISQHDRIARTPSEHLLIRETLRNNNILLIVAATEALYDSGDIIVDIIKDGNSKLEVENTRIRTKDTMKSLFKSGIWRGGKPPFGYCYDKQTKSIIAIDHELQLVRQIFGMYLNFDGFDTIASKLPEGSYNGSNWTDTAVKAVITNPFYAGYLTHCRKRDRANNSFNNRDDWDMVKSDLIQPVISMEVWERCWELYEQRLHRKITPNQFKTSFLLMDLIYCNDCSKLLKGKDQSTKSKKGKKYGKKIYYCPVCKSKFESTKLHRLIDVLLLDLKKKHEEDLVLKIMDSYQNDLHRLENEQIQLTNVMANQEEIVRKHEIELRSLFAQYTKLDDDDSERPTTEALIRILTMSKEHAQNQLSGLQKSFSEKERLLQHMNEFNLDEGKIKRNIAKILVPNVKPPLLRGLLFEFVKEIRITPSGNIKIVARHEIIEQMI